MPPLIVSYIYEGNGLEVRGEDLLKLTHLNVAFGRLMKDGSIHTEHLCRDGRTLSEWVSSYKKVNPALKVLLSIGSGDAEAFSVAASTAQGRETVARECARLVRENGLDGVDYDWEYPCCPSNRIAFSPEDRERFTLLCAEIRRALDGANERALFTIAAGAGDYYLDFTQMDRVAQYLDYVFLMTYDLRCGFHSLTGHHTNLYRSTGDLFRTSADGAVRAFRAAGVPAEKICLGAAFYSRQWNDVPDYYHGFLQYVNSNGGYGPDYTKIVREVLTSGAFQRYWDDEAKAPYLYDGHTFISYDDPDSLRAKCAYVREQGLAGVFAWEYNCDRTGTLLETLSGAL